MASGAGPDNKLGTPGGTANVKEYVRSVPQPAAGAGETPVEGGVRRGLCCSSSFQVRAPAEFRVLSPYGGD